MRHGHRQSLPQPTHFEQLRPSVLPCTTTANSLSLCMRLSLTFKDTLTFQVLWLRNLFDSPLLVSGSSIFLRSALPCSCTIAENWAVHFPSLLSHCSIVMYLWPACVYEKRGIRWAGSICEKHDTSSYRLESSSTFCTSSLTSPLLWSSFSVWRPFISSSFSLSLISSTFISESKFCTSSSAVDISVAPSSWRLQAWQESI